jgi:UDP-glucose 4-epimerase
MQACRYRTGSSALTEHRNPYRPDPSPGLLAIGRGHTIARHGDGYLWRDANFVGLNLAEALLKEGREVVLADRLPPPEAALHALGSTPGTLRVEVCDVRDTRAVSNAIPRGVDRITYGAAITLGAERDARDPAMTFEVNLLDFLKVLARAKDVGVGRILNFSSVASYGEAAFRDNELDESRTPTEPQTLYGISKLAAALRV